MDLEDAAGLQNLFAAERFDRVVNLAAQAGVRYSLTNPDVYVSSNIQGFLNILEAARRHPVEHLVYASSSSVYGIDPVMPFAKSTASDHPASLYAVSKRSNELMAHSYSHLYQIPTTGLRFFTVYGPWGRPDMALFLFTKAILEGNPIDVFNYGEMQRDFTYVDDIVEGIVRVVDRPPAGDSEWDGRTSHLRRLQRPGAGHRLPPRHRRARRHPRVCEVVSGVLPDVTLSFDDQHGANFLSAMPCNLYGPGDNFNLSSSHVLPTLIRKIDPSRPNATARDRLTRCNRYRVQPAVIWP